MIHVLSLSRIVPGFLATIILASSLAACGYSTQTTSGKQHLSGSPATQQLASASKSGQAVAGMSAYRSSS